MSEGILSKRQSNKIHSGKAPLNSDNYLKIAVRTILQVIIFTLIYTFNIQRIREATDYVFVIEIVIIFGWMILSDIIARACGLIAKIMYNYKRGYVPNDSQDINYNRKLYEYILYFGLRSAFYAFGVTSTFSNYLYSYIPYMWGFIAYFLAWLIISLLCRVIAIISSIYITKST